MRDHVWNVARLRYIVKKSRVKKAMQDDWLRQDRERQWEEAHQQYLTKACVLSPDDLFQVACVVCAATKKFGWSYAKLIVSFTTAWWERKGALVVDQVLVPSKPYPPMISNICPSKSQSKRPSYLRDLIQSYWHTRTVSNVQRRAWEDRRKIKRVIRQKYNLADDFDIDTDFLGFPIPASHAQYQHEQIQDGLYANERHANRHKRRAEDYRPSRSSLALFKLAEDIRLDDTELERSRLAEKAAGQRRWASISAAEVGYLYFVGDMDLLEKWRDDVQQSNLSLIYREKGQHGGRG